MFGKLKEHKKKVLLAVTVITAIAAVLVGDADYATALNIILSAIGLS